MRWDPEHTLGINSEGYLGATVSQECGAVWESSAKSEPRERLKKEWSKQVIIAVWAQPQEDIA